MQELIILNLCSIFGSDDFIQCVSVCVKKRQPLYDIINIYFHIF
jgi:hypothetical protein